jgi:hypothetical protein
MLHKTAMVLIRWHDRVERGLARYRRVAVVLLAVALTVGCSTVGAAGTHNHYLAGYHDAVDDLTGLASLDCLTPAGECTVNEILMMSEANGIVNDWSAVHTHTFQGVTLVCANEQNGSATTSRWRATECWEWSMAPDWAGD